MGIACTALALSLVTARVGAADDEALRPTLHAGSEIDYPPFCFADSRGRADGFSVELLRAAAHAMGRDVSFEVGTWAALKAKLERAELQALPLVGRTFEREVLFDFTVPYMSLHGAIVVRDDVTGIQDLDDLRGLQVAVMQGDNADEFLRREPRGLRVQTTATFEQALRELSAGQHDAVVMQRLVALRLIAQTGLSNLRIVEHPVEDFTQDFSFAVPEGHKADLALLNEGLALVTADGTYRRLHAKWFAALELPSSRRLVVGGDRAYPPYEYLDAQGEPAGYNVELVRAVAREVGLDLEIRLLPWTEVLQGLERGDLDVVQGIFYSPERGQKFDFSPPHVVNHSVCVVRKGTGEPPGTLQELAGKRLVVERGDIMHDWALEQGLGAQLTALDTMEDALRALAAGQYDCALVSRLTALHWMQRRGWKNLVVGRRTFLSPEYCFAVRKGQKALLAQLSEGLRAVDESGQLRRIQVKWLGVQDDSTGRLQAVLRFGGLGVVTLLGLVLGFVAWSWSLRRQVAARTAQLADSERRFRLIAENASDVVWSMDLGGRFTYVSPSVLRLRGYTADEVMKQSIEQLLTADGIALFSREMAMIGQAIAEGRDPEAGGVVELEQPCKDGSAVWTEVSTTVMRDDSGAPCGILGVSRDIGERKQAEVERQRLEEQLRQTHKMEAVGQLAGGVAHDFNNLLTVINNRAEFALEGLRPPDPLREDLAQIREAGRRAAELTRQLLAFSRKQLLAPVALDLGAVVQSLAGLLGRLLGEHIAIELRLAPGPSLVRVDRGQLEQVLINLAVNARDAMPQGGTLTLATSHVVLDAAHALEHVGAVPGPHALLTVADTGHGMDRATLARAFEPFFTTKPRDRGTGLGLATVYGIVAQSGGHVAVDSEPGKGTVFRIYLPLLDAPAAEAAAPPATGTTTGAASATVASARAARRETVLLVEDEPAVRRVAERILAAAGYTVLSAEHPEAALRLATEHQGAIALLLTDVVMPVLNGRQLADRLLVQHPGVRVLFMSGYTDDAIQHHGVLDAGTHFIGKPFSRDELQRKVREVLDAARPEPARPADDCTP